MFRHRLTARQVAVLSAITRSPKLKRTLIEATTSLQPGTSLPVGEAHHITLGPVIGAGLVGVAYLARPAEQGGAPPWVYKRARARFGYFEQALSHELEAARQIERLTAIQPAQIVARSRFALLKRYHPEPTLLALLKRNQTTEKQRGSLVAALSEAEQLREDCGLILDLSPKNLCWTASGWVLLDAGPKIHTSTFSQVTRAPSWRAYLSHFQAKIDAAGERSMPSALSVPSQEPSGGYARWVFLDDLYRWFPEDPAVDLKHFFVDLIEGPEPEILMDGAQQRGALKARTLRAPHGLLQRAAQDAWPGELSWSEPPPPITALSDGQPLSLPALMSQMQPLGFGKALQQAPSKAPPLALPSLKVQLYDHWTQLGRPDKRLVSTDVFAHDPLPGQYTELPGSHPIEIGSQDDGRFAKLYLRQAGKRPVAIVLVPGFRAPAEAATALCLALIERGLTGLFAPAYVGYRNTFGQALVSAGRWESIMLMTAIDHLIERYEVERVQLVAASQGTIGAMIAAQLHPAVSHLVVDSPFRHPLSLLEYLAEKKGEDYAQTLQKLAKHNLPHHPFELRMPQRPGLRTLALQRRRDRFIQICGALEFSEEQTVYYEGRHAQSMRHDSGEQGVPDTCVNAIYAFLQER